MCRGQLWNTSDHSHYQLEQSSNMGMGPLMAVVSLNISYIQQALMLIRLPQAVAHGKARTMLSS
jgi:hypothetical protein